MSETFDRSQLDGKDRDQLSEIATALGVKSISRLRKAELVDAIVTAATGSNGGSPRSTPRKVRSTGGADDDFASIAAEENALAGDNDAADEMALIRPRRRSSAGSGSDGNAHESDSASNGSGAVATSRFDTGSTETETNGRSGHDTSADDGSDHDSGHDDSGDADSGDADSGSGDRSQAGQSQWRDDDASGNKRRRRRRVRLPCPSSSRDCICCEDWLPSPGESSAELR